VRRRGKLVMVALASVLALPIGIERVLQQLAVPQNDGQQVVEVVRHAAGEPSDGLHLLGLP